MSDRLALAVRTMPARRDTTCPACGTRVQRGQQIAMLTNPTAWIHERCIPVVAATLVKIADGYMDRIT